MTRRSGIAGAAALVALLTMASSAWAQVTTASVTGTVKDPQGAVVPGVAVTLISETRGTQMPEVFTNTNGDFTFANVSPDRYTVQVAMDGFKTQRRTGVVVSAGDRMSVGAIAHRGRRAHRHRAGQGRIPRRPDDERRAILHGGPRSRREPADRQSELHGARLSRAGRVDRRQQHADPHRRRRRSQHHDGRRVGDGHRQQPSPAADERRVDCRSESADVGLPGGVRARERRADHGRHEGRHQPLPRVGLRRGAEFEVVREQQDQQAQWRPQGDPEGEGLGLFDRRPDRQTGWEQQAVLLLRPGILAAHGREQRRALPDAHRARTRGGLLTVDRQQRQPVPVHQRSAADGRVLGQRIRRPASGTAACSARSPRTACTKPG